MPRTEKWSLKFDRCVTCGGNDVRHIARGLCLICYERETAKRNRGKKRDRYDGSASRKLNYKYLLEEYINKKRSLGDIAKECGCSRQYVYRQLRGYAIPLRSKTESRILALTKGKVSFDRIGENGKVEKVTLQKNRLNEKFFRGWSNPMAYVLGVIYTDGNVRPGLLREPAIPDTLRIGRLTVAQKEPELLQKILNLMECDAKLLFRKRKAFKKGVAGPIYYFHINNDELYDDLIALGLLPNKSLNMTFPDVPTEHVRHFIRGCWDGDGSIYFESKKLRGSYTCGSVNFIERLVQELYKTGIYKRKPPLDETDADKMWLNYPDGRFPLKIHQEKRSKSYYIKVDARENLERLFHYFYDGVEESLYLTRKYAAFVKGLRIQETRDTEQLTLDLSF